MTLSAFHKERLFPFLLAAGAALFGFCGMFARLAAVFSFDNEDMAFAWYVPVFSVYVLWSDRAAVRKAATAPDAGFSAAGLLASAPFLACALLGARGLQVRLEQVAFIGLCITMPWTFFGRALAARCLFPALFLVFTIPMNTFLDAITVHLRIFASSVSIGILNGIGLDAIRNGTVITASGMHPFSIDVAEPCAGLRSIFALTALTAAYSWFTQPTWARRGLLFLCAPPLAVAGNVARILSICLVSAFASPEFAAGFYHDYSGYVVFLVAVLLMVACGEAISSAARRIGRRGGDVPGGAQ